jgi:trehalose 6-phosphate phosphatase
MKKEKLWLFDFDGTLAAIGHNYHAARLHPDCQEMLIVLIEKFPGRVAVVSSRPLHDLVSRIPVPGLFLGGSSGLAWLLPGGEKKIFQAVSEKHLSKNREAVLLKIQELGLLYDVDTEDKLSSVALHAPHLPRLIQQHIFTAAKNCGKENACEVFVGPESVEIYFLPASARLAAIPNLCSLLGLDPEAVEIIYAGDDAHDIPLMQWILQHTGRVYTVGYQSLVAGGQVIQNASLLAQECIRLCERPGSAAA